MSLRHQVALRIFIAETRSPVHMKTIERRKIIKNSSDDKLGRWRLRGEDEQQLQI